MQSIELTTIRKNGRRRELKLTADRLRTLRHRLVNRAHALWNELLASELRLRRVERSGDATAIAAARKGELAELLTRARGYAESEVGEIQRALVKLDGARYGMCERCGRAIPLRVLHQDPATRICPACERAKLISESL